MPTSVNYAELDRVTLPAGRYVLQQTLQASALAGAIDIVCHLLIAPPGSSSGTKVGLGYSRLRTPDDTSVDTTIVGAVEATSSFDAVVRCVRNSGKNVGTPRVEGMLVLTPVGSVSRIADDDGVGGGS